MFKKLLRIVINTHCYTNKGGRRAVGGNLDAVGWEEEGKVILCWAGKESVGVGGRGRRSGEREGRNTGRDGRKTEGREDCRIVVNLAGNECFSYMWFTSIIS